MVLQNSYLMLSCSTGSCQFVYIKELGKTYNVRRRGRSHWETIKQNWIFLANKDNFCFKRKCPLGCSDAKRQSQLSASRWQQTTLQTGLRQFLFTCLRQAANATALAVWGMVSKWITCPNHTETETRHSDKVFILAALFWPGRARRGASHLFWS